MIMMSGSAANVLTGIVTAFKTAAQSNEVPLKTIVAVLLLYGVKEFLNDIIFSAKGCGYTKDCAPSWTL